MSAYYNEFDPFAAEWLENLIKEGLIPDGYVDRRSIKEVSPEDLVGFEQVHLFSGIGGWALALRLAGWPDDRPVWTGSCPCQPFSSAGKQRAQSDDRHLWPEMFRLIKAGKPVTTFGEQVASAIGFGWLDGICDDLEGENYEVGAIVLGAFSVNAPHQRKRLYWVAVTNEWRHDRREDSSFAFQQNQYHEAEAGREYCPLDHPSGERLRKTWSPIIHSGRSEVPACSGSWSDSAIVECTDGTQRRVGRGVFPLAHGIPKTMGRGQPELSSMVRRARSNRTGRLKGYGNAIVPQVAAEFVRAFMEVK